MPVTIINYLDCRKLHRIGRPGGNRTPNLRFWRPPLCQLSYWPNPVNAAKHPNKRATCRYYKKGPPLPGRPDLQRTHNCTLICRSVGLWYPRPMFQLLIEDFRNNARTHCAATFTNCKAQTIFHGDRVDQLNYDLHVITRHHHLGA